MYNINSENIYQLTNNSNIDDCVKMYLILSMKKRDIETIVFPFEEMLVSIKIIRKYMYNARLLLELIPSKVRNKISGILVPKRFDEGISSNEIKEFVQSNDYCQISD